MEADGQVLEAVRVRVGKDEDAAVFCSREVRRQVHLLDLVHLVPGPVDERDERGRARRAPDRDLDLAGPGVVHRGIVVLVEAFAGRGAAEGRLADLGVAEDGDAEGPGPGHARVAEELPPLARRLVELAGADARLGELRHVVAIDLGPQGVDHGGAARARGGLGDAGRDTAPLKK